MGKPIQHKPVSRPVPQMDKMPEQADWCCFHLDHVSDASCWCQPVDMGNGVFLHFVEANN